MRENDEEAKLRTGRSKLLSEENESYKTEIESLMSQMKEMAIDYDKKIQEYELKKKRYDEHVENVYRDANFHKVQIE